MAMVEQETVRMLCTLEFWRMAILWPMSLFYSYVILLLGDALGYLSPRPHSDPPLGRSPPVCVITGATSGLGAEVAKVLAGKGYHIVLAGRSRHLLAETMERIKQHNSSARLKAFDVDLSSIHSIIQFKCSIEDWLLKSNMHPSVQLLINNAGILATSSRATADGYDQAADPGAVETNIMRELPKQLSQLAFAGLRFFHLLQTPEDGVASIIDASLAPPELSGEYFFGGNGRTVRSSTLSYNSKLAKELWDSSVMVFHDAISKVKHSWNGAEILLFGERLDDEMVKST